MWLRDNIEKTLCWGTAFIFVSSPAYAFAASNNPGAAGAPLFLACALAYLTRRRAIGGWLCYFYFQLYISLLFWPVLFAVNIFKYLAPSEWASSRDYALFLLSTVPLYMTMCTEAFFATVLLFRRNIEHVRFVRYSLIAQVATASLSLSIAVMQSDSNIVLDTLTLSFAVIWCLYFFRSCRVQLVLVENRWNHDEFSNRFGVPTVESLSRSKRTGWVAASATFCYFFAMSMFAQDPPKPLEGVFQGLISGAIIGAIVQHFTKRPKHARSMGEEDHQHRDVNKPGLIWRQNTLIKISSWICGACVIVWIIIVAIISSSTSDWGFISLFTAFIAIGAFALSYLGGHIIIGNKGAIRLSVFVSVLWVVGSFVVLEPYNRYRQWTCFFVVGIIPVISYLGILWVISGFLPKKEKMEDS
jgi:hypothetical protein